MGRRKIIIPTFYDTSSCTKSDLNFSFFSSFTSFHFNGHILFFLYHILIYLHSSLSILYRHLTSHCIYCAVLCLACHHFHHLPMFISHCMNNFFHNMKVIFCVKRSRLALIFRSQNDIHTSFVINACSKWNDRFSQQQMQWNWGHIYHTYMFNIISCHIYSCGIFFLLLLLCINEVEKKENRVH